MPQSLCDRQFLSRCSSAALMVLGTLLGSGISTKVPAIAQTPPSEFPSQLPSQWIARSPESAPAELTDWLSGLDDAASAQDLEAVMGFYGANFRSDDGLTRQMLGRSLFELWETFPGLTYKTTLTDWDRSRGGFAIETTTEITSPNPSDPQQPALSATVTTRQIVRNGEIIESTVLAEETEIKRGDRPPSVWVRLPERVRPGDEFTFDAIVQEPLSDDLLAGAAIDEPVTAEGYRAPGNWQLETLSAGGLFKTGIAPNQEGPRWISAVLVSGNGTTIVTRRLQVKR